MAEKPAILQDQEFTLEEGAAYRVLSRLAIWMNKLLLSCLFLLLVWLVWGSLIGAEACTETVRTVDQQNGTVDAGTGVTCNVFLTPTTLFLAAMAVLSFLAQIAFGVLGLVVGKRLVPAATPARQELPARGGATGTPGEAETDAAPAPDPSEGRR